MVSLILCIIIRVEGLIWNSFIVHVEQLNSDLELILQSKSALLFLQ